MGTARAFKCHLHSTKI